MNQNSESMEYNKKVMPRAGGDNERVKILKTLVYHTKEIIKAMGRY